jgi:ClpP class serine protease
MKKLTAEQKRAAIVAGASMLSGLTQSGRPFCVSEQGLSRVAARIQMAERPEVVAGLFWDDDDDADDDDTASYQVTDDGTAIIPIYGVMLDTAPSWWLSWYGATSTPQITTWVQQAAADANVKRILLDVDTPGGQASGVSMLADAVFAASAAGKPVWAMCREACSAGYFVARSLLVSMVTSGALAL